MLERLKQEVSPYIQARRWYVAFSGGLDSSVLLHSLVALTKAESLLNPAFLYPDIVAVHVNHGIQQDAHLWQQHCEQQAQNLGVECLSFSVTIDKNRNVEEHARNARYGVFADVLQENDVIFMGHHLQDQVETFFYRLFRGAGVKGLSAMQRERVLGKGRLSRPLLDVDRTQLEKYANGCDLSFIVDPSNKDIRYDRNFIRQQLLPVIQSRWPSFLSVMQRNISHLQDLNKLLDEVAANDLTLCAMQNLYVNEPSINVSNIQQLSVVRQKNLLRFWLSQYNLIISDAQLQELMKNVIGARIDAQPEIVLGNKSLRRFQQNIYITDALLPTTFTDIVWSGKDVCDVPGFGRIRLSNPLDITFLVCRRQGGEEIKPAGSMHTRKLKTLLQELGVPPWQRERLPLIYCGNELIAIADLILADGASAYLSGNTITRC